MNLKSILKGCPLPDGPVHLLIDNTGLKVNGAGEWLQEKHGAKGRRTWRKLHLAVDAVTGMIVASTLTEKDIGDPSQVAPLLDQVEGEIASITADGAPIYEAVVARAGYIPVIIPPHVTAVPSPTAEQNPSQRDRHIALIATKGRLCWQKETGYSRRSLVETTMGRHKGIIGPRLRAQSLDGQDAEAAIGIAILNRMLHAGRPDAIRRLRMPS
jgi:hypothetical protein